MITIDNTLMGVPSPQPHAGHGATQEGTILYVRSLEHEGTPIIGVYIRTVEDVVEYWVPGDPDEEEHQAPSDCVDLVLGLDLHDAPGCS